MNTSIFQEIINDIEAEKRKNEQIDAILQKWNISERELLLAIWHTIWTQNND
jgi:hypothetical protein